MRALVLAAFTVLVLGTPAAAQTTVQFDGFPDLDSHLDVVLPKFQETHPEIAPNYVMNEHGDHHRRLTTNLATGSGAGDVVAVDVGYVGAFINAGGFVDLSAAPYNAGQYQADFPAYAWAQGTGTDGGIYAIPVDLGPGVLYFRRDRLAEAGWSIDDVIADWDSYIAYGEALKAQGVYLLADASEVAQIIINTTVEPGNGLYFDADGNPIVTNARFVTAFETARRVRELGLDAQIQAWTNEWYGGFRDGSVATQPSGAWLLGHLQNWMAPDTAGLWGVANLPDGIYGSWGGSFLAIPRQSENKEAAWELIRYLTLEPEVQLSGLETIAAFPALASTYDDPALERPVAFLDGQKAGLLFASVAEEVPAVLPSPGDQIAFDLIFNGVLPEVLNEGRDIQDALAEAERLIRRRTR